MVSARNQEAVAFRHVQSGRPGVCVVAVLEEWSVRIKESV